MGVNGTIRVTDQGGRLLCELPIAPDATVALLKEMIQIEVRVWGLLSSCRLLVFLLSFVC